MSIDLTQAKNDVTVNMHTEADSSAMALKKTGTSKNITAAEWNSLVYMLAYLAKDSTLIAGALSDAIDAIGTDVGDTDLSAQAKALRASLSAVVADIGEYKEPPVDGEHGAYAVKEFLWELNSRLNSESARLSSVSAKLNTTSTELSTTSANVNKLATYTYGKGLFDAIEVDVANQTITFKYFQNEEPKSIVISFDTFNADILSRLSDVEGRATDLETEIGSNTTENTVKGRVTTLEGKVSGAESDIAKLETQTKIEFDPVKKVYYLSVAGNRVSDLDVITKGVITSAKYEAETNSIVVTFADGKTAEVTLTDLVDEALIDSILKERYDALVTGTVKTEISNNAELKASVTTAQTSAETARSFANASSSSASAAQNAKTASETAKTAAETAKAGADVAKAAADTAQQIAEEKADIATAAAETAVQAAESAQQSASTANSVVSSLAPRVSAAEKRLTNLEKGITPDPFVTDDTVAYQKTVPENALPFAAIERVGGMSYKCKNLFGGIALADKLVEMCGASLDATNKTVQFTAESASGKELYHGFKPNTQYTVIIYGKNTNAERNASNLRVVYTDDTYRDLSFSSKGDYSYCLYVTSAGKTVSQFRGVYAYDNTILHYEKCGIFEGVLTAEDFEPYFEGIRHAAVTAIERVGKNIFGGIALANALVEKCGASLDATIKTVRFASGDASGAELYHGFEADKRYTVILYGKNTNAEERLANLRVVYTDDTFDNLAFSSIGDYSYCVFVTPVGKPVSHFRGMYGVSSTILHYEKCGIFEGVLTAENFLPYAEPHTLPIPEELRAFDGYGWGVNGTYNNHYAYGDGRVTWNKPIVKKVFNGSESWTEYGTGASKYFRTKIGDFGTIVDNVAMSNRFDQTTITAGSAEVGFTTVNSTSYDVAQVSVRLEGIADMTVADFKAMLAEWYTAGNPFTVYYTLAVPEVTDITDLISPDNFIQVEGVGTITVVNEYELAAPSTILYMTKEETV